MSFLAYLIAAGLFLVSIFKPGGDDLWLWGLMFLSVGHLLPDTAATASWIAKHRGPH